MEPMQPGGIRRRDLLKGAGFGALALAFAGPVGRGLLAPAASAAPPVDPRSLVCSDGYITLPGAEDDPIYIFGFVGTPTNPIPTVAAEANTYKGHVHHTAPTFDFLQGNDDEITLTNVGFIQRPDLDDSHTIHWHGFDLPSPLNDGVPELSVAVPVSSRFTYFYRPHRPGTYMYHCHFEDVEHVQMGMTGAVFVRPTQDGTAKTYQGKTYRKFAYNDGDGSTGYDRHYALLLNEVDRRIHDADRDIQPFIFTEYRATWFTINGRCYPQTVLPNDSASLPDSLRIPTVNSTTGSTDYSQPNSALIQINEGERGLIRIASLGYYQHSMQLPGVPLHVVGQDASLLRNGTVDTSYFTDTIYIGPGEARDVLFDAPAYSASAPSGSDSVGNYNVYYLASRDWRELSNNGAPGPGGMMTEVRVYAAGRLAPQTSVSQTYV